LLNAGTNQVPDYGIVIDDENGVGHAAPSCPWWLLAGSHRGDGRRREGRSPTTQKRVYHCEQYNDR
jgi:hypothetical protein